MHPRQLPLPWPMATVWGTFLINRVTSNPSVQDDESAPSLPSLEPQEQQHSCTNWPQTIQAGGHSWCP